jgi:uncharacterized protein (TIGR02266 family)
MASLNAKSSRRRTLEGLFKAHMNGDRPRSSRPSSPDGIEHRAHTRVKLEVDVGMHSESHFFTGLSGDLSEGGVFVATYRDVPIGSKLEVDLPLPDGTIQVHGVVKWTRPASEDSKPGIGVAFETLPEEQRARIAKFCAEREPLYFDVD